MTYPFIIKNYALYDVMIWSNLFMYDHTATCDVSLEIVFIGPPTRQDLL